MYRIPHIGLIIAILFLPHSIWGAPNDAYLTLGPIQDPQDITDLLNQQRISFTTQSQKARQSLGFIVVTDRQPSLNKAQEAIAELHFDGVTDLLYIKSGDYERRISAGVFATKQSANLRMATLVNLGYDFSVIERSKQVTSTIIDVTSRPDDPLLQRLRLLIGDPTKIKQNKVLKPATHDQVSTAPAMPPEIETPAATPRKTLKIKAPNSISEPPQQTAKAPVLIPQPPPQQTAPKVKATPKPVKPVVVRAAPSEPGVDMLMMFFIICTIILAIVAFVLLYRQQGRREQTIMPFQQIPGPINTGSATIVDLEQYATSLLKGNPTTSTPLANLTQGGAAIELLDDVILLVKMESGGSRLQNLAFDISSLINDIVQQFTNAANNKGISLFFGGSEQLPELVSTDSGKLSRILQSLITHCIDQTESGRVLIEAEYNTELEMLSVEIIHPGNAQHLDMFNPDLSTEDLSSSHRLRLAVCLRLAKLLGGDISVNTFEGDTKFSLDIVANEIKPRQLDLPDCKSLDDLISSEKTARQLSDERLAALQEAQAEAAREVETRTDRERQLSIEIERLKRALDDALSEVQVEAGRRSDLQTSVTIKTETLSRELEQTKERLAEETREKATADANAIAANAALTAELESIKASVEQEQQAYQTLVEQSKSEIQNLSAALTESSEQLQTEIQRRTETEGDALTKVTELEQALSEARQAAEAEAAKREAAEQTANSEVQTLTQQLQEANSIRAALDDEREGLQDNAAEINKLEQALTNAKQQLEDEANLRAESSTQSEQQVHQLLSQLQDARSAAESETAARESLQREIDQLAAEKSAIENELAAAKQQLQDEQARLGSAIAATEEQEQAQFAFEQAASAKVKALEQELNTARKETEEKVQQLTGLEGELKTKLNESQSSIAAEIAEKQTLETEAKERVTALTLELQETRQLAEEAAEQRAAMEATALSQVEELREQLAGAESALVESQQQQTSAATDEIEQLRLNLSAAEERLELEKRTHVATDGATGEQISNMMDELNQANMTVQRERSSREQIEKDSQDMLQAIEAELAQAQEALGNEIEHRRQHEEEDTRIRRNLKAALVRAKKLQTEKEQVADQLKEISIELVGTKTNAAEQLAAAKTEAQNFARAEAMAREQLAQIANSEPDQELQDELKRAKSDAQNYARAEAMAKEQLAQLTQRLNELESGATPQPKQSNMRPIVSSLPMGNPVMHAKMQRFMVRLIQHLDLMEASCKKQEYLDLVVICNWLKSETQSMGFDEFISPTHDVELMLRSQAFSTIPPRIEEMKQMAQAIKFDATATTDEVNLPFIKPSRKTPDNTPIQYELPSHERKAEMLENFISQVGSHLMDMQIAWQEQKSKQLTKHCTWTIKYGTKLKVQEVIYAAEDLQEAIEKNDPSDITDKLLDFIDIYVRIELVNH